MPFSPSVIWLRFIFLRDRTVLVEALAGQRIRPGFCLNHYQLNWWFASALKGLITGQRLKTHRMVRQSHYFYRPPLKRPVFLCLGILTTCKRVKVLFHRYLIRCNVFLQLVLYVFSNRLRITAYGIHIVPTTPKMSVPVFVL